MVLALAHFLSKQNYWAKDIVILFPDGDNGGLKHWLTEYFDPKGILLFEIKKLLVILDSKLDLYKLL